VTGGFSGATQVAVDLCLAAQAEPGMQTLLVLRRKRNTSDARVQALRDQGLQVRVVSNWLHALTVWELRRIIRDFNYRGYSAQETISRWPSVRAGEDKWIFPYQENADVMFNSALLFEFAVLRCHAEPILTSVPRNCPEYAEAYRLLKFIKYFTPVQDKEIPPTSLLREFLGGSSFKY
jgi:hypothetical protein